MLKTLRHPAACLLYFAAAWGFYAPPRHWPGLTLFGGGQDPLAFLWFINWWPFALSHHLPLFYTHYAEAPVGTDMVWKTSVPALGLIAAPVTARFGAVVSYNLLAITAPPLAAFGVYLAAFELTGVFAASLLTGALFAFSGYELGQAQGHLNLSFCAAVPFGVLVCLRAARHAWPSWRLGLVTGALLVFEFGTSQEIFTTMLVFGALALVVLYGAHPPARHAVLGLLAGLGLGLLFALVAVSPVLWRMLRLYHAAQANLSDPGFYGSDVLSFIIPSPINALGGHAFMPVTAHFRANAAERGAYFGLPLLALMSFIICRGGTALRAAGLIFAISAACSLGPYAYVLRHRVSTAPWLLAYHLPFLRGALPCRFILYAWIAAALLLALWLAEAPNWRRYGLALLCLACLVPSQSFNRAWEHPAIPPVFASLPAGAHVLVLPLFGQEMGWQYASGMRFYLVAQGYLGTGRPAPFKTWPLYEPLWQNRFAAVDPRAFSRFLDSYGAQYIVLLPHGFTFFLPQTDEAADHAAAETLLAQAGWVPVRQTPDAMLYERRPN